MKLISKEYLKELISMPMTPGMEAEFHSLINAEIRLRIYDEQTALDDKILYGDLGPMPPARPGSMRLVFDETANFEKGKHVLALRKFHKENVLGQLHAAH